MFIEKEKYIFIEEFLNENVITAFTKKELGDMGIYSSSDKQKAYLNIQKAVKLLNLENKKIVYALQTHSTNILNIDDDFDFNKKYEDIDGFATNRDDVILIALFADCLPIYIYDTQNKVISLIHSGWRGTYQRIIEKALFNLQKKYNSKLEDLIIGLGVGISYQNYEIDKDFYEKFKNKFSNDELKDVFYIQKDKYFFDNTKLNENLALKYGIIKNNIIKAKMDVISSNCHSYRRDKKASGRSIAIMSLNRSYDDKKNN